MVRGRRFVAAWLALGLVAVAARAEEAPAPLARYAPVEKLIAYFEFDGLKAHRAAWEKTAARKALDETKLGSLLEDLARQVFDAIAQRDPNFRQVRDQVAPLLTHVKDHGFLVAFFGDPAAPSPLLVARGAGRPEVMDAVLKAGLPAGEPIDEPREGRKLVADGSEGFRWVEGEDLVFVGRTGFDAVIAALDGKAPSVVDHPIRSALAKVEDGLEPVAVGFVDLAELPEMPSEAIKMGLDGVKRVELRWGFQDDALVTTARVVAPAPRRGLLTLLDQPTFGVDALPPIPASQASFAALSIDLAKTYGQVAEVAKADGPEAARKFEEFEAAVRENLGLDLRADLLPLLGPKAAVYLTDVELPEIDNLDLRMARTMAYAGLVVSVEAKDEKAVGERLEGLIAKLNAALAAQAKNLPEPPKFVREKGEGAAYVMDARPLHLPPFLADLFSPTIAVGGGQLVFSPNRDAARLAVAAGTGPDKAWKPTEKFVPMAKALPANMLMLAVDDVRETIPALIEGLPEIVDGFNSQMAQAAGEDAVFIEIDPADVPTADQLAPLLFPTSMAITVDDEGLLFRQRESIPSVTSPATAGVVVALLLPAVQSAREAARPAQCVNNLKQIGLAFHNFLDVQGAFPGDIVDEEGKPLLSWRVAILPYIEEQELYNKFKLDEPWDSPHNKPLLEEMPGVFLCPSRGDGESSETRYQGFAGPRAMFEPGQKVKLEDILDGTSFTLLVVESEEGTPWTKPGGIPFDPEAPGTLEGVGSTHPGGFNALFTDGSVRFLKQLTPPTMFKALITRDGGEVVDLDDLNGR
jgi:prepilin-type processing-associated H-X9-DG protein